MSTYAVFKQGILCLMCDRELEKNEGIVIFNFYNGEARLFEKEIFRFCFSCFTSNAGNDFIPFMQGKGVLQNCFHCNKETSGVQSVGIAKYGRSSLSFHLDCFKHVASEEWIPPCEGVPQKSLDEPADNSGKEHYYEDQENEW